MGPVEGNGGAFNGIDNTTRIDELANRVEDLSRKIGRLVEHVSELLAHKDDATQAQSEDEDDVPQALEGEDEDETRSVVTPSIRKHAEHLAVLARAPLAERDRVLRHAPDSLHTALADVARLVLNGKLELTPAQVAIAERHARALRNLVKWTKSERAKMLRPQRGGFLGHLADILGQVIGPVLGTFLK